MNRMPGFNAVSSLSKSTQSYHTSVSGIPSVISPSVMPQALRDVGSGGGGGGAGLSGLGFTCGGTSCRCDGDSDCNDMFSTNVCGPNAYCYLGWLTGEWVCTCQR